MKNYRYVIVHSTNRDEFTEVYTNFAQANIDARDMWQKLSAREQQTERVMVIKVPKNALRLNDIEDLDLSLKDEKAWRYFDWDLVESYDKYFDSEKL